MREEEFWNDGRRVLNEVKKSFIIRGRVVLELGYEENEGNLGRRFLE